MFGCLPEIIIGILALVVAKGVFAGLSSFFGLTHMLVEVGCFVGALLLLKLGYHYATKRIDSEYPTPPTGPGK